MLTSKMAILFFDWSPWLAVPIYFGIGIFLGGLIFLGAYQWKKRFAGHPVDFSPILGDTDSPANQRAEFIAAVDQFQSPDAPAYAKALRG